MINTLSVQKTCQKGVGSFFHKAERDSELGIRNLELGYSQFPIPNSLAQATTIRHNHVSVNGH